MYAGQLWLVDSSATCVLVHVKFKYFQTSSTKNMRGQPVEHRYIIIARAGELSKSATKQHMQPRGTAPLGLSD